MEPPIRADLKELEALAIKGDVTAQYNLARTYYQYDNNKAAFHWYAKAARQGNADAIFRVAGYLKTPSCRFEGYLKAARGGSALAQWFLGNIYKYGGELYVLDIAANEKESLYWYRKAAEQNYPLAICALAHHFHFTGKLEEAVDYYFRAYYSLSDEHYELAEKYLLATGKPAFEKEKSSADKSD